MQKISRLICSFLNWHKFTMTDVFISLFAGESDLFDGGNVL